jgi:hypothetical protein
VEIQRGEYKVCIEFSFLGGRISTLHKRINVQKSKYGLGAFADENIQEGDCLGGTSNHILLD